MDTRQLAAFCEVVERRSFSQAAERLGVTQPAVSLQVRALEKRLGTQLLDRSGPTGRADRGGPAPVPRRPAPAAAGRADPRRGRVGPRRLAHRRALDRRLDRPCGRRRPGSPLRVPPSSPGAARVARGARHADGRRPRRRPWARARHRRRRPPPSRRQVRAAPPRRGDPHLPAGARVRRPHGHRRRAPRRDADPDAGRCRRAAGRRGRAAAPRRAAARSLRLARARPAGVGPERGARRLRRHVHLEERGRVRSRSGHACRGASRGDGGDARDLARACGRAGADACGGGVRRLRPRAGGRNRAARRGRPRPAWPRPRAAG